jgi:hypothetical protein
LNVIRDMIRLEKAVDECLTRLETRARALQPDSDWSNHDDVESIASSSMIPSNRVRIIGRPPSAIRDRDSEQVRQKVGVLEHENLELRKQVQELQKLLAQSGTGDAALKDSKDSIRKEGDTADQDAGRRSLSEGAVWNLVHMSSSGSLSPS